MTPDALVARLRRIFRIDRPAIPAGITVTVQELGRKRRAVRVDEEEPALGCYSWKFPGLFAVAVRGVSFRQDAVAKVEELDQVFLVPEPTNQYDPNAIRVEHPEAGLVGYLPRRLAAACVAAGRIPEQALVWWKVGGTPEELNVGLRLEVNWSTQEEWEEVRSLLLNLGADA